MTIVTKLGKFCLKVLACGLVLTSVISTTGCNKNTISDNALSEYNRLSSLALDSLGVLKIHDADSYDKYKNDLKNTLGYDVYTEYFSAKEYTGYETSEPLITVKSIKGDISNEEKSIFKIDIEYLSDTYKDNATMLITVEDGRVTYIERI